MRNIKLLLSVAAASVLALNGCINISRNDTANFTINSDTGGNGTAAFCTTDNTISGDINSSVTWTEDTCISGKVRVGSGATLTVADITVAGKVGTKAWIEVLPGGKIDAENVIFTSEQEAYFGVVAATPGQWGGITLIGSDDTNEAGDGPNTQLEGYEVDDTDAGSGTMHDSSGRMVNCTLNNTGVGVILEKEINGLSLYAVGDGTEISGITVNRSGDDAVEIWGGHVNLTDVTIAETGDDGFDNDDGWAGSVVGLKVSGVTNSGLELSGITHAIYENVEIDVTDNIATTDVGGAIYLKKTAIGGYFTDVNIIDNQTNGYGTIVTDSADLAHLEGTNITITKTNVEANVTEGPNFKDSTSTTPSATPAEVAAALRITL